jgi:hypothetical protein
MWYAQRRRFSNVGGPRLESGLRSSVLRRLLPSCHGRLSHSDSQTNRRSTDQGKKRRPDRDGHGRNKTEDIDDRNGGAMATEVRWKLGKGVANPFTDIS